jgi:adenosylmethionine-8-amino-7-oxononanoate aminotransferase
MSIRSKNCFASTPHMNDWKTEDLVAADKRYQWHPSTSMHDWCAPEPEPLVLVDFRALHVSSMTELEALPPEEASEIAAVVIEPMVQGVASVAVRNWCDRSGALLMADEALAGFGRTGRMFACYENIVPDIIVLVKALNERQLTVVITVLIEQSFSTVLNYSDAGKTFYYGHGYTWNALGCAAAKASLEIFEQKNLLEAAPDRKINALHLELATLRDLPWVADVRQCGFIAGVELPAGPDTTLGAAVCFAARRQGLLTKAIRNVIVVIPHFCISPSELRQAVQAIASAIEEVCARREPANNGKV